MENCGAQAEQDLRHVRSCDAILNERTATLDRSTARRTETVPIRDDEEAPTILHQLRELGVRIALDDFSTIVQAVVHMAAA